MRNRKAIIIGAGISGLATAWRLAQNGYDVTVLEKERHVGGLAATIDWDGWKFDFGAHSFHTRQPEVTELYKELLRDRFILLENLATRVFIFGKLVHYPLVGAHVFTALNSTTMIKAGLDFLLTRLKALVYGIEHTERLDEWIIWRFGRVLYNVYFAHYIERIQKTSPALLSSDLGTKKIPIFSVRQYLVREILRSRRSSPDDVATLDYYYPIGGYGQLSECFRAGIMAQGGSVKLGEALASIEVENREVVSIRTERESYDCRGGEVVSTVPLTALVRSIRGCASDVVGAAGRLRSARMRFLLMKVNRPSVMGFRWVNFSDVKFPFYRVSENVHDVCDLVPEHKCSLVFEIPLSEEDTQSTVDDKSLVDAVVPLFNEAFELAPRDIIDVKSLYAANATPIMSLDYRTSLRSVFAYVGSLKNLYSIGRQGLFTYVNVDGCTNMALGLADSIVRGDAEEHSRRLLKAVHGV